jgi:HD-GYP domain-containing protein (c-di-GMP phosphodiesterase class II)
LDIPVPFSLLDDRGVLLAQKGFVFQTESLLLSLANRGNGFFIDFSDVSDPHVRRAEKAYVNQLLKKLRNQNTLGELSKVHVRYANDPGADDVEEKAIDWLNMVEICNSMLHTRDANFFNQRLESIAAILTHQLNASPDESLMALFYLSEQKPHLYSATHSMLVCAICVLTASTVLRWSAADIDLLMRGALTMNMGMVDLQDDLTTRIGPLDISQKFLIGEHANLSAQLLEMFGVEDQDWLDMVRGHHIVIQEPLLCERVSDRLIGLLQRADIFSAKLSSRSSREAQHSSLAMKSIYFDSQLKPDAVGAAIIKAVGIYRPGSFVKLVSGEVAVVTRRGENTATPMVAVVLNKDGMPVVAIAIRNTTDKKYAVASSVASATVNVTLNLERMLNLSRQ